MITVKISGGLGNQIFQYAMGRHLEVRRNQVVYDISAFNSDPQRCYLLPQLGLKLPIGNCPGQIISDVGLRYDPKVEALNSGNWILAGFWQCERYFLDVRAQILAEVFANMAVSEPSLALADMIRTAGVKSCFLHVRRTDNTHPAHTAVHGLVGLDYYSAAASYMRARLPGAKFFVFSDDPVWARANMTDSDMTVVDCNPISGRLRPDGEVDKAPGGKENEDLYLMSLCRHGIVANSTFSWWGAWLNPAELSEQRYVVAPIAWFNLNNKKYDATDIVPSRWARL